MKELNCEAPEIIERIPIDLLTPTAGNRRIGGFNQAKLEQLAESIKNIGVQQAAVVRRKGDGYEIVAGERRWRASRLAGVTWLPCTVRELTDAQALHIQIIENIQREDVHALDEAEGYDRLKGAGFAVEQIASEVGRTPAHVYQRLKLLDLIPAVRDLLMGDKISTAVAVHVARLDSEQQEQVFAEYLDREWNDMTAVTARIVSEWIQRHILHDLSKVTWSRTDASLVPSAGSCSTCPKRTGASPALFEDLGTKKDQCTNVACFETKAAAIVKKRRAELEGTHHILVKDNYTNCTSPGVLKSWEWNECKKGDDGAVRVLVVDGDKPGRLTWGKASKGAAVNATDIENDKLRRAHELKIGKARTALLATMFSDVRRATETLIASADPYILVILRLAVTIVWNRCSYDGQTTTGKVLGWEKPDDQRGYQAVGEQKIADMGIDALMLFLVDMSLAPLTRPSNYYGSEAISKHLKSAAEIMVVDFTDRLNETATAFSITEEDILGERPNCMRSGDGEEDPDEEDPWDPDEEEE
ncbi:MAG: hypothetical protein A2001_01530 [Treponema sp. GWC1_61_84]|nr:MAG: hypothetical protein A2001_01530 [Treponema sp. GWC1_61_84]